MVYPRVWISATLDLMSLNSFAMMMRSPIFVVADDVQMVGFSGLDIVISLLYGVRQSGVASHLTQEKPSDFRKCSRNYNSIRR